MRYPVAVPVVQNTIYDPSGKPWPDVEVRIRAIGSTADDSGTFDTATDREYGGDLILQTDSNGYWQANLTPSASMVPSGNYARVTQYLPGLRPVVYTIQVPATVGPHWVYDLRVSVPGTLPAQNLLDAHAGSASDPHAAAGYAKKAGPQAFTGAHTFDAVVMADAVSLPAASVTYRGRTLYVYGGAGVADGLYVCRKAADGTYAWVLLS